MRALGGILPGIYRPLDPSGTSGLAMIPWEDSGDKILGNCQEFSECDMDLEDTSE